MHRSASLGKLLVLAMVLALVFSAVFVAGCTAKTGTAQKSAIRPAVTPPPPMLRDPRSSVYSYLVWISYAYRILDSDVATMAFSPYEEVRVNAYVQLNRQNGQAIEQTVTSLNITSVKQKDNTATVSAVEEWSYRYIDIKTRKYKSAELTAAYDSTYTVVYYPDKKVWLVDKVVAAPRGKVQ